MNFLVTGGAGRLGSKIVQLIIARGNNVRAFDLPNVQWGTIMDIPGVQVFQGNVTDPKCVSEACQDVDVVIHLAALLPPKSEIDEETTFNVNVEGARIIVENLMQKKDIPLIFASSISTYGITTMEETPLSEDHPQRGHNNYSESKIEAEELIKSSGVPHVILRIAPIAVAELVELPDVIPYKANQRVEFVYVADAARALAAAAENPKALGNTFNIAGGSSWQMNGKEYIEGFYGALGVEVEPKFSTEYTALDWYDTSKSQVLDYQHTSFNLFQDKLREMARELGLS